MSIIGGCSAVGTSLFYTDIFKQKWVRKILPWAVVLIILTITVFSRTAQERECHFSPFWSYAKWGIFEIRHEIIQNIIMFIPLGTFLRGASDKLSPLLIIVICIVFSVSIEATQYIFSLGVCEIDDVINNTMGGIIGVVLYGRGKGCIRAIERFVDNHNI